MAKEIAEDEDQSYETDAFSFCSSDEDVKKDIKLRKESVAY